MMDFDIFFGFFMVVVVAIFGLLVYANVVESSWDEDEEDE